MSFDYRKFLFENQLTTTAILAERDAAAQDIQSWGDETEDLPDVKSAGASDTIRKSTLKTGRDSSKLAKLIKQKDEILAQYKSGAISLDQYKTKIGNIPQQIKQLRAAIDPANEPEETKPSAGAEQEPENDAVYTGDDQAPVDDEPLSSWDTAEDDTEEEF